MDDFNVGAFAMISYLYNTSAVKFVEDVYGADCHPSYAAEKVDLYATSQTRAIGALDEEHLARLFRAVRSHEQAARVALQLVPETP